MIEILKKSRIFLCRLLEVLLIAAVFFLTLVVLWGVATRWSGSFVVWLAERNITAWSFLPRGQNELTEEIARFLLIWVALLGSAVAFGEKMHLGVDYFVGKLDISAQKLMTVVSQIIILIFTFSIFIVGGSSIVSDNMGQVAPALGAVIGLKLGHVYLALPISGIFIIIFTVEQMLETIFSQSPRKEVE